MIYQLRDYQQKASDAAVSFFGTKSKNKNGLLILPTGCHAKGSKILQSDGKIINVEDVQVGHYLLGDDGTPRKVLQLHRGTDEMYRVTPIKGAPFVVNGGHILHLYRTPQGGSSPCEQPGYDEISVSEYVEKSKFYKHIHKLHRTHLVEFGGEQVLPYPYLLGLYLGDGGSSNGSISITTMEPEIVEYLETIIEPFSLHIRVAEKTNAFNKAKSYFIV